MRPKKHETTGAGDLFRARLDQIINLKHELVQLAGKIDWAWIDGEIAPLFSDKGRPATSTRFVIGLLLLKHIFALSDEQVCERWVYDPYFQYFTGAEFFQHVFPHERSDLSHWRNRLGDKLELHHVETILRYIDSTAVMLCHLRAPSLLMRARALATVREWKKRLEHQAHSRFKSRGGCGLPVGDGGGVVNRPPSPLNMLLSRHTRRRLLPSRAPIPSKSTRSSRASSARSAPDGQRVSTRWVASSVGTASITR
jgi:hypothetical protein